MIHVKKVISDNFDGYMELESYKELKLQMSTGDFHTHTAIDTMLPDWSGVWFFDTETLDFFKIET